MDLDKENKKNDKVEEPRIEYEVQKPKFKGIDPEVFNFDAEFARGLSLEEAKAESKRRIGEWWNGRNYKEEKNKQKGIGIKTFDFEAEFKKGLTPAEFKNEMSKRIQNYHWKK